MGQYCIRDTALLKDDDEASLGRLAAPKAQVAAAYSVSGMASYGTLDGVAFVHCAATALHCTALRTRTLAGQGGHFQLDTWGGGHRGFPRSALVAPISVPQMPLPSDLLLPTSTLHACMPRARTLRRRTQSLTSACRILTRPLLVNGCWVSLSGWTKTGLAAAAVMLVPSHRGSCLNSMHQLATLFGVPPLAIVFGTCCARRACLLPLPYIAPCTHCSWLNCSPTSGTHAT